MKNKISGVIPALITPFNGDGSVNTEALKQLTEKLIEVGVGALYCCGSTGEAFLMSLEERKQAVKAVVEANNDRVPVVVQVGNVNVLESVELAKFCEELGGVYAVSALPPIYYCYSKNEIANYFKLIMDASSLPMIIYNIPHLAGKDISTFVEVFNDKRVIGIKHTTSDLYSLEAILDIRPELEVYFGQDEQSLAGLSMGVQGMIGSTYNFMADKFIEIYNSYKAGEVDKAYNLQRDVNALITLIIKHGVYNSVKYLVGEKFGILCGSARAPFLPLTSEAKDELKMGYEKLYG